MTDESLYKEENENPQKTTAYRRMERVFKTEFRPRGKNKRLVKIPLNKEQLDQLIRFPCSHDSETISRDEMTASSFESRQHHDIVDVTDQVLQHATQFLQFFSNNESIYANYMNHPSQWKIYALKSIHGGFYFIKNVFEPHHEFYWTQRCLKDYAKAPNKTNMDLHLGPQRESTWNLYHDAITRGDQSHAKKLHKQLTKTTWCTLGYQYEWTSRKYIRTRHAQFPLDASQMCTIIANVAGVHPYTPEAAIVNFYHENMRMGGHKDESEETMEKPIVSVSFGSSAIYLLGGDTRDEIPRPILIESGDVMVLGGEARMWYHGIARVLENSCPEYWKPKHHTGEMEHIATLFYCENRRINMNVRQVYDDDGDISCGKVDG